MSGTGYRSAKGHFKSADSETRKSACPPLLETLKTTNPNDFFFNKQDYFFFKELNFYLKVVWLWKAIPATAFAMARWSERVLLAMTSWLSFDSLI